MAVIFSSDTFLPAPNVGENFLKIRDVNGTIRYKVYNNTISSLFINLDTLVIKTEADSKAFNVKFSTSDEAQTALMKLQAALVQIKQNFQTTKNSKFSDLSFEIYNDTVPSNFINFNLNNLTTPRTLTLGTGTILQTETELVKILNNENQFRYFEHFLIPHTIVQGTYTTATIKPHSNETFHNGILEMTLTTANSDAFLWSSVNSFQLNSSSKFATMFRVTDLTDNYKIVIGFFNNNNIGAISKGAYFTYDFSLNNNWLVKSLDSTSTIQNTLVALDTNWHKFAMSFNLLNELEFYIDDVLVSTIDTNVPTAFGSETSFGVLFEKVTSTVSTSLLVDWLKVESDF